MFTHVRRWSVLVAVTAFIAVAVFATQSFTSADGVRYHDEVFSSADVTSDIQYGQAPDYHGTPTPLKLDLYQPHGDTETSRPVYIWIHGGSFCSGDKAMNTEMSPDVDIATSFAKRGYVVASINYRMRDCADIGVGWGTAQFDGAIADAQHDAQAAVRWFRANAATYGVDANHIAIGGYSAGAITSLYVGYHSDDPGDSGNAGYPSNVWPVIDVCGGFDNADVSLMQTGEPPLVIVHGTSDTIVPYFHTTDIVNRATAVGIPYELHTISGASHFVFSEGHKNEIIGWTSNFLYLNIFPEPTATPTPTNTPAPTATPTPKYVGGWAEPPDGAAPVDGGSDTPVAVFVALGAGAVLLASGGVYARRRYSRGR